MKVTPLLLFMVDSQIFSFLIENTIDDKYGDFWPKISIFKRNFDFRPKFRFLQQTFYYPAGLCVCKFLSE